ncbi:cupin-like domain-containing protein [Sphingomonas sp. VNH70]|uniref:cupin-like domain-containing protein n=1 Tax=Sphingomonas silueang TaxID=3156617 RepID=UPI0032B4E05C
MTWIPERTVPTVPASDAADFAATHGSAYQPVVLRGLVADWPLVQAGANGARAAADCLARYDRGDPTHVMRGPPEIGGRFFYDDAMRGFNFKVERAPLSTLMAELIARADDAAPPGLYAGSAPTAQHLPGFAEAHPMPLAHPDVPPRIWVGNRTRVAAHYDVSDNVAVVAMGRRRFTLFPPAATPDLYVGPLDVTIAGQPVSMVDLAAPDLARFPRFAAAMDQAMSVVLEPGDAIFVPTLWWHAVEALDPVNILVNYWYNQPPAGSPFAALLHAMLSIRDLPAPERAAWAVWFEQYVFRADAAHSADHLPPHAQGVAGPPSPGREQAMRAYLRRALG